MSFQPSGASAINSTRVRPVLPVAPLADELLYCRHWAVSLLALVFLDRCRRMVFLLLRYAPVLVRRRQSSMSTIGEMVTSKPIEAI